MNTETWLDRLQMLSDRFTHLGIGSDIAAEAWGLYLYLSRLADGN